VQYGIYLSKLLRGDLGPSFKYQDYTVVELIGNGFPVSFRIGITAIILAADRRRTRAEFSLRCAKTASSTTPS